MPKIMPITVLLFALCIIMALNSRSKSILVFAAAAFIAVSFVGFIIGFFM